MMRASSGIQSRGMRRVVVDDVQRARDRLVERRNDRGRRVVGVQEREHRVTRAHNRHLARRDLLDEETVGREPGAGPVEMTEAKHHAAGVAGAPLELERARGPWGGTSAGPFDHNGRVLVRDRPIAGVVRERQALRNEPRAWRGIDEVGRAFGAQPIRRRQLLREALAGRASAGIAVRRFTTASGAALRTATGARPSRSSASAVDDRRSRDIRLAPSGSEQ